MHLSAGFVKQVKQWRSGKKNLNGQAIGSIRAFKHHGVALQHMEHMTAGMDEI
jgi:hypothetical protein